MRIQPEYNVNHPQHRPYPPARSPYLCLAFLMLCWANSCFAENAPQAIIRHCGSVDAEANVYIDNIIELALSYSGSNYTIEKHGAVCSHPREVALLEQGKTDFFWAGTTEELEQRLIPIRIPVYKGMLGYRLLLIRKGDQARFNSIKKLAELRNFTLGQGETWADTAILKHAGFNLVTSSDPKNLAYMLHSKRFDAYPRGMMEPWGEILAWSDIDLAVEQELVIIYPMPAYIFISPHKKELATTIERGLHKAVEDGSFDKLFYNDSRVKPALIHTKLENRRKIYLPNPYLPKATPINNPALWLNIEDINPSSITTD